MESKLIPLLIVLALLTGCASTSTSEEAATAPVDVPVQTSGTTVAERPHESLSASVASIDADGSVRLVIEGGLEAGNKAKESRFPGAVGPDEEIKARGL